MPKLLCVYCSSSDRIDPKYAAAAAEPELLAPLQEAFQRWQAALAEDGLDPVVATVVRLASDGLWLCDLFGLGAPERLQRRELRTTLERLTEVAR